MADAARWCRLASPGTAPAWTPTEIERFVSAHALKDVPARPVWILEALVSGPDKVLICTAGNRIAAVAAVVDTCDNATNSAEVILLAAREAGLAAAGLQQLLTQAERIAANGPRDALMVAIIPALAGLRGVVERRGYRHSHTVYVMEAERPRVNRGPFLPQGLGWTDAAAADAPGYYDALLDAFDDHPDVSIPPYETFRQSFLERLGSVRLLKEGADVVGFVRFAMDCDTSGRIELLGRVSRCRGRGLGIHILREALVQLRRRGARRLQLEVAASSPAAIRLYENAGFRLVRTVDSFVKALRPS